MPVKRPKKEWADPNREGQAKGKEAERFCSKCGNTVQKTRILKSLNLCEYCVNELREKRDGITSCRGCGKIEPLVLKEHNGYCTQCICSACGKPDPQYVRKTGLCFQCAINLGDFCRSCGKEAAAQVRKNKGFCDECVASNRHKTLGRHRRSTGYQGKRWNDRGTKTANPSPGQNQATAGRTVVKGLVPETKKDLTVAGAGKSFPVKYKDPKRTTPRKPGSKSPFDANKQYASGTRTKRTLLPKNKEQRQTDFGNPSNGSKYSKPTALS